MSLYRDTFTKRHTLLLVVHITSTEQAIRNTGIARDEGADGVFLINHHTNFLHLLSCFEGVRRKFPEFWIGINCLDLDRQAMFKRLPVTAGGFWADDAGIQEEFEEYGMDPSYDARKFFEYRAQHPKNGIYFGGVAFKYQKPSRNPAFAAKVAAPYVDVVITSGVATGVAADVEKIKAMKIAMDDAPLALASGVTPENVSTYLPYVDCFVVSTGVSDSETEFNRERVREMRRATS